MILTPKQQEYRRCATRRWNVKTGATRSGKTYGDYFIIPKRILAVKDKEGAIVILGNTRGTIQRNIIEPMQEIYGTELVSSIHADNTATMFGARVHCLGADNKKHVDRIRGMSIAYCYGDEVTTWVEDVFTMLKSRLDKPYSTFDGTCNPDTPLHWFHEFLESDADIYQQSYTIDDNPRLPPEFVENLKREYAGTVYYDRYILGLWTAAEGAIYRPFCDNPEDFILDEVPGNISVCNIGVDFGAGTPSANAFSLMGFTQGFRQLVTLEEYYNRTAITPTDLERDFVDFVHMCLDKGYAKTFNVYCDSAEQTLIKGIKAASVRAGLPIAVHNARKGPINDRIRFFLRMMGTSRYKIMRGCKATQDALKAAVWDSKAVTHDVRLDDGKLNIDSLDSMEYAAEPYIGTMIGLSAAKGAKLN